MNAEYVYYTTIIDRLRSLHERFCVKDSLQNLEPCKIGIF